MQESKRECESVTKMELSKQGPSQNGEVDPEAARAQIVRDRKRKRQAKKVMREKSRLSNRMMGFNVLESEAWMGLCRRYGPEVTHEELISVAELVAQRTGVPLDRDAKRRKSVLIKWFAENWSMAKGLLDLIVLEGP